MYRVVEVAYNKIDYEKMWIFTKKRSESYERDKERLLFKSFNG